MYLTIITTVLVLTQIIRLCQNAIQLKHLKDKTKENEVINEWKKLVAAINKLCEKMEDKHDN